METFFGQEFIRLLPSSKDSGFAPMKNERILFYENGNSEQGKTFFEKWKQSKGIVCNFKGKCQGGCKKQ